MKQLLIELNKKVKLTQLKLDKANKMLEKEQLLDSTKIDEALREVAFYRGALKAHKDLIKFAEDEYDRPTL